jgi:exosortase
MKLQTFSTQVVFWLRQGTKNTHRRVVFCGAVVVLASLLLRLSEIAYTTLHGSSSLLMAIALALGIHRLWSQRQQLNGLKAGVEDRILGYLLMGSGIVLFPLGLVTPWTQALLTWLILAGIACSCWGISFFGKFPLPIALIILGLLPQPTVFAQLLWQTLTPPQMLERWMAWAASLGLTAIGQSATTEGILIVMPRGSVEVGWGCNGMYMAATMAIASLTLGLWLQQSRLKILALMAIGIGLAMLFNIPRLMLVAIAAVYWGKDWFEFWHSSWGSQIFVGVLFTLYYYVVMAMIKGRPKQALQDGNQSR